MDLDSRADALRSAGLSVLDVAWYGKVPSPMAAWQLVIAGRVVPTAVVGRGVGEEFLEEIDVRWAETSESLGLFGEHGDFLISISGAGAASAPWALVRRNPGMCLSGHLGSATGEPEFVTMSMDGRGVCGVTTEEYEVWIVSAAFTQ